MVTFALMITVIRGGRYRTQVYDLTHCKRFLLDKKDSHLIGWYAVLQSYFCDEVPNIGHDMHFARRGVQNRLK